MEDDSLLCHHHLGSARHLVKGMESVVATVSGYHGSERFNLIKLIDRAGASYVGSMSQSITHLVCWKFEGRKYELAKKFRIPIVNHCWIEECVKKGRRVSEEPYTYCSGEEMGPLVLDILLGTYQEKDQSKDLKNAKRPIVDTELDDMTDAVWKERILLDEDLFPERRQNSHGSTRPMGKAIRKHPRKGCTSSNRHDLDTLLTTEIIELEEASTSQHAYSIRQEKRNSTSSKSVSKGLRLVKKQTTMKDWLTPPNVEEECDEVKVTRRHKRRAVLVDSSEEIEDLNDDDIEEIENAPSSMATPEELHEAPNNDSTEHDGLLPASSELSCVICWTDFCSTRGVLPCGHRFCFSCIQNWADHMTSRRKPSTCPLCKASFVCITKVDDAVSSDQKIYSQSMPNHTSNANLYILPHETYNPTTNVSASVCFRCSNREPADLLVNCNFCQIRCVHSYCLDPPLFPWTCVHCKELQMLYLQHR